MFSDMLHINTFSGSKYSKSYPKNVGSKRFGLVGLYFHTIPLFDGFNHWKMGTKPFDLRKVHATRVGSGPARGSTSSGAVSEDRTMDTSEIKL